MGYHPEIILTGRRMNDSMGQYVSSQVVKLMLKNDIKVKGSKILGIGITFKENCLDVGNTKVIDVVRELKDYKTQGGVFDPSANPEEVMREYGLICYNSLNNVNGSPSPSERGLGGEEYKAIVSAVAHEQFLNIDLTRLKSEDAVVYDIKGVLTEGVDAKL